MKKKQIKGFTLVELLAVIVILAIILVIAVPQIMNTIKDATKASFESSSKMVASQAENQYTVAKTLNKDFPSTGSCMEEWAGLNEADYESCTYEIINGEAEVTIGGKGKFNGLYVCEGTKSNAIAVEKRCLPKVNAVNFTDDDWFTIVVAVKRGNHPYVVGNEKTIEMDINGDNVLEQYTIRVANTTPCNEEWIKDLTKSQTACGFVLEFADVIAEHEMNATLTNVGGWPASAMRTYVNETIYNALPEELREGIIDTYVVSSHGNLDEGTIEKSKNFGSTDKLYLLSTEEIWAQGSNNIINRDTSLETSRQLDYYANNNVNTAYPYYSGAKKNNGINWWLRSASSTGGYYFFHVTTSGDWDDYPLPTTDGVSPAFRIG